MFLCDEKMEPIQYLNHTWWHMTFWGKWGSTPPSIKQPMEKENTTSRSMALEDCTQLHPNINAGHIAVGGVWLKFVCSKTADNEHVPVMFSLVLRHGMWCKCLRPLQFRDSKLFWNHTAIISCSGIWIWHIPPSESQIRSYFTNRSLAGICPLTSAKR